MKSTVLAVAIAVALASPALADDAHHKKDAGPAAPSAQATAMAEGEVRRVDKDAKKITLRHGPLPSLDMPAMTMVFQVRDPAMLDQVKVGDKVKFAAEKIGGAFTLTTIEAAK